MIFATFSVKPHLPQNRLQLAFTVSARFVLFINQKIKLIFFVSIFSSCLQQLHLNLLLIAVCRQSRISPHW